MTRLLVVLVLAVRAWAVEPTIAITSLPPYAVDGSIRGSVTGVDFATHRVAVYIQIEGLGWWTKPTQATPTVGIDSNGSFTADVATDGLDNRATIFCAALIPDDVTPPFAGGARRIPPDLAPLALDCRERYSRTFEFAGHTWAVKEAPAPVGPGKNRFSARPDDVFVDDRGLHLTIRFHDGFWWATEVILLDHPGFGTYSVQTDSRVDTLDANATFGAFTWDPYGDDDTVPNAPNREIDDLEDSRWGNPTDPTNSQAVVQPADVPGNLQRYTIPDLGLDAALTRFFTWGPTTVDFVAARGHHSPFRVPAADVFDRFSYTADPAAHHFIPTPGRAAFRLNLWLNDVELGGAPPTRPAGDAPIEVVINDVDVALLGDCQAPADHALDLFDVLAQIDVILGRTPATEGRAILCDDDCDADVDIFDVLRSIDVLLGRGSSPLTCPPAG